MQKHGNGLLTGIGVLLLIAVIFFGIALINAIDNQRFAIEKLQASILELQDQGMSTPAAFMTPETDRYALKEVADTLKEVTDQIIRQKSVNPDFTQRVLPSLDQSIKRLESLFSG